MVFGVWILDYLRPSPIVKLDSRQTKVEIYNDWLTDHLFMDAKLGPKMALSYI